MKNEKGFTLVELMVALAISSLLAYAIFVILRTSDEQAQSANVKMTIQDSAREGLYKMIQEIRLSAPSHVTILNNGASIQFSIPDSSNALNSDYTVNWNSAHPIIYILGGINNKQILRTDVSTGQITVVANDVTSLTFSGDAVPPQVITVTMALQRAMTNTRQMSASPLQISAKAELRNS